MSASGCCALRGDLGRLHRLRLGLRARARDEDDAGGERRGERLEREIDAGSTRLHHIPFPWFENYAAWTRADPEVVWTALTDPGQTPGFLYGLAAHSTWIPGAPIGFRCGGPGPGGCTIRLQIDEIDTAGSLQDAEDIWLPVLEALQRLVNPGQV